LPMLYGGCSAGTDVDHRERIMNTWLLNVKPVV
jgi:hypothetical protein